jgi:RNA polymerase sigma-70 factor (family 1)
MMEGKFSVGVYRDDVKAFEALFKSHYAGLTLFANKFLNNLQVSEEIVSDSLTHLWANRETLTFSTTITGYLYKMVQNKSLNYLKHQKIENEYVNYLIKNNLISEMPDHDTDPYQEKEVAAQIKIAINSLPERCRQVFILSRFEYLKNREIAERLDISQNTVERQITIALDKLRKSLEYTLGAVLLWILF